MKHIALLVLAACVFYAGTTHAQTDADKADMAALRTALTGYYTNEADWPMSDIPGITAYHGGRIVEAFFLNLEYARYAVIWTEDSTVQTHDKMTPERWDKYLSTVEHKLKQAADMPAGLKIVISDDRTQFSYIMHVPLFAVQNDDGTWAIYSDADKTGADEAILDQMRELADGFESKLLME